jgi:ribosome-associated protein
MDPDFERAAPGALELAPGVRVAHRAVRMSYSTSRGPGGQNVNKRLTKAELRISLADVPLPQAAHGRLARLAKAHLAGDGEIVIASDEHRSQSANRAACFDRLRELIVRAKVAPKTRRRTRPSRGSVERRLEAKRRTSESKASRREAREE